MATTAAEMRRLQPRSANPDLDISTTHTLRSGHTMPLLGLGSWMLTSHTAERVAQALSLGYRMVDTSADYNTQQGIGKAIRLSGTPRDSLYIVTKVEEDDDGYDATRKNLDELKLEYADLVLIHRPPERGVGEKVWEGLMRAREEGLARDIGVSSYKMQQMDELARNTGEMPAVNQIEWTPFGHSLDMLNFCRAHGVLVQAWSPLTRGKRLRDEKIAELADQHGKSPAQIVLRWNLQHGVVPLPKAQRADHQQQNVDLFDFALDAVEMASLDALNQHFSALEKLDYV
jgi:diketogulonate reductase-like aldo/keto reductase